MLAKRKEVHWGRVIDCYAERPATVNDMLAASIALSPATETTSPATIMPPGDGVLHSESIGKTVPCGDIRVMDDQGRELPPGEEGELWIAGPMIVPGYWRNEAATAASFVGGYWRSGDIGAIDAEGYVRIADRMKVMINRAGFKVYPAEVPRACWPGSTT